MENNGYVLTKKENNSHRMVQSILLNNYNLKSTTTYNNITNNVDIIVEDGTEIEVKFRVLTGSTYYFNNGFIFEKMKYDKIDHNKKYRYVNIIKYKNDIYSLSWDIDAIINKYGWSDKMLPAKSEVNDQWKNKMINKKVIYLKPSDCKSIFKMVDEENNKLFKLNLN